MDGLRWQEEEMAEGSEVVSMVACIDEDQHSWYRLCTGEAAMRCDFILGYALIRMIQVITGV